MTVRTDVYNPYGIYAPLVPGRVIVEARERHKLRRMLDQLDAEVSHFPHQDALTLWVRSWSATFRRATHATEFYVGLKIQIVTLLQRQLVDALPLRQGGEIVRVPLDRNALLGSDGHIYGSSFLSLVFAQISIEARQRSPLDLNSSLPFTTIPHGPARFLIRWLEELGIERDDFGITAAAARLEEPRLPLNESHAARIARLRAAREARAALAQEEAAPRFSEAHAMADAVEAQVNRRVAQYRRDIEAEIATLDQLIQESRERCRHLLEEMGRRREQLHNLSEEMIQLENDVAELERQIEERNQGWFGGLIGIIASIGITVALNTGLPGSHMAVHSTGGQFGMSIPF